MNLEIRDRWVAALRSGKYKQGEGVLRESIIVDGVTLYSYCCLGLLADIVDPDGWGSEPDAQTHRASARSLSYLSKAFCASVGLPEGYACSLAQRNDSTHSFAMIAADLETDEMDQSRWQPDPWEIEHEVAAEHEVASENPLT